MLHLLFNDVFQDLNVIPLFFICYCFLPQSLFELINRLHVSLTLGYFCRWRAADSSQVPGQLLWMVVSDLWRCIQILARGEVIEFWSWISNYRVTRRHIGSFECYGVLRWQNRRLLVLIQTFWHVCILSVCFYSFRVRSRNLLRQRLRQHRSWLQLHSRLARKTKLRKHALYRLLRIRLLLSTALTHTTLFGWRRRVGAWLFGLHFQI